MEHINMITRDSLLAFIDWSITQDLKPDIFFHFVYQWFTKDSRLLSDTEAYIMSASFLLAKQQADDHKIPDAAALLWNDLILTTTKQKKFYTAITREDLFMRLDKLVHLLNSTTTSDTSPYQLLSNYSLSKNVTSFVGRETLLEKLHRCLSIENHPVFLYGIAGIGKSALAQMYLTRYAAFYDTIIFAAYEENLQELLINDKIFPITNFHWKRSGKRGEKGRYFRKKLKLLSSLVSSRTLIIIDNFDTTKDAHLSDILKLPCKIIFTTRTLPQCFGAHGIAVSALSDKEELRKLFYLYHPSACDTDDLDLLLRFLHGHTLAIQLTATHLSTTGKTLKELLKQNMEFLRTANIEDQLIELFRITMLTREERAVLRYLSIMPVSGISLNQFAEYCHFTKMSVIDSLTHRNMIQINSTGNHISIHPLLAQVIRKAENPTFSNCWTYASTICQLAKQTWWLTSPETDKYREYLFSLMKYLVVPEERRIDSIIYLVDGCWQLGNFTLAEKYGKRLHTYCSQHFGSQHLITARVRHSIGTVYYNWGKLDKAYHWYTLGYHEYKDSPNPDVYFYGILLMKVGRTMRLQKNWTESEDFLTKAISFLQGHLAANPDLPSGTSPKQGWLVLLFDIYSEMIALYIDKKGMETAWTWCLKYKQEYDLLQLQRDSSLWILYYYMGLCRLEMDFVYRKDAQSYLATSLDYAQKYHKQNLSIQIKILSALEKATEDKSEKSQIRQEKQRLLLEFI